MALGLVFAPSNFTVATPVPLTVSGLRGWWEADSGPLDASDVAITVDGTAVKTWQDQSGNGNHVVQNTSGQRPVYKTGQFNGKPGIQFVGAESGGTQVLTLGDNASLSLTTVTLIAAVKHTFTTNNLTLITKTVDATSVTEYSLRTAGLGTTWLGQVYDVATNVTSATTTATANNGSGHVVTGTFDSSAITMYYDGTAEGTPGATPGVQDGSGNLNIGAFTTTGGSAFGGTVAEILVYNSVLSTGDRQTVEHYLGSKYGITVA